MTVAARSELRALDSEDAGVSVRAGATTPEVEAVTCLAVRRESTLGSTTAEATSMTATADAIPRAYGRQFLKKEVAIRRLFSPSASGVKRTPSAEALSKNLSR